MRRCKDGDKGDGGKVERTSIGSIHFRLELFPILEEAHVQLECGGGPSKGFFCRLKKLRIAINYDDLHFMTDALLGNCQSNARCTARDDGRVARDEDGCHCLIVVNTWNVDKRIYPLTSRSQSSGVS